MDFMVDPPGFVPIMQTIVGGVQSRGPKGCDMTRQTAEIRATLLRALLRAYQALHPGAMYSGGGGGYLLVVSNDPVPGSFHVRVRQP